MSYVTPFITYILNATAQFLGSEPIIYFVSIFILAEIIQLIKELFHA